MEKSWKIRGAYGDWSMTVKLVPNGEPCSVDENDVVANWPHDDFASIGAHFSDVVDLHELGLVVDTK